MIVYMTRKHRRALAEQVGYRVRGSSDTLRAVVSHVHELVQSATDELCICPCGVDSAAAAEQYLDRADDALWDLLSAHTPWWFAWRLRRSGPVRFEVGEPILPKVQSA